MKRDPLPEGTPPRTHARPYKNFPAAKGRNFQCFFRPFLRRLAIAPHTAQAKMDRQEAPMDYPLPPVDPGPPAKAGRGGTALTARLTFNRARSSRYAMSRPPLERRGVRDFARASGAALASQVAGTRQHERTPREMRLRSFASGEFGRHVGQNEVGDRVQTSHAPRIGRRMGIVGVSITSVSRSAYSKMLCGTRLIAPSPERGGGERGAPSQCQQSRSAYNRLWVAFNGRSPRSAG